MGFLSALFSTAKWNNDPNSKELARMLLEAAQERRSMNTRQLVHLISEAGWSRTETKNRLVHAVSMIKPIADQDTYETAREVCRDLYVCL